MTKESIIAYISKLNDRNLQRKRESGFTLWAIMGVIAIISLDLIDKVILVYSSIDLKFFFIIFSGLSILCVSIFLAIFSLSIASSTFKVRRFYTATVSKSFLKGFIPISLILLVFAFISFKAAKLATTINISSWIFWIFVLFFASNAIFPLIIKLYKQRKSSKIKLPYPELSIFSNKMKLFISIIYAILSIGFLIGLYLTFKDISLPLTNQQISLLVKTNIEILGFFLLVIILFENLSSSKNEWLENLEMEIYLSNLTESEIKEKLETEYIGIDIYKWITKRREKLNEAATKFLNSLEEETPKIEELKTIDGTFKHEIAGRRDEICKRVNNNFKEYSSFLERTTLQFKEINKQGIPDKEEFDEIKKAFDEWKSQINQIGKGYKDFCNRCQQACLNRPKF